jgi:ribosome-binding factor A
MTPQLASKSVLRTLCAELSDEDGVDPHHVGKRIRGRAHGGRRSVSSTNGPSGAELNGHAQPTDRKACQLCRQVAVTLDEVFAECGDPLIQNLRVEEVTPTPDGTHLLVTVAPLVDNIGPRSRPHAILAHLERASGHLRYQVASSITRKRAPLLHYRLADPNGAQH